MDNNVIKWVCVMLSVWGWVKCRQEEGRNAEPWYFKARHWHKSPRRRRGSSSSQGRVGRAMGQPLPGLACWYLQMPSLKCWRSCSWNAAQNALAPAPGQREHRRGGPLAKHRSSMPVPVWHSNTPTLQYTAGYSPSWSHSFLSCLIEK